MKNEIKDYIIQWVVIGSAGDLSTFGDQKAVKRKGMGDGLTGAVLDLARIQRMLYNEPRG